MINYYIINTPVSYSIYTPHEIFKANTLYGEIIYIYLSNHCLFFYNSELFDHSIVLEEFAQNLKDWKWILKTTTLINIDDFTFDTFCFYSKLKETQIIRQHCFLKQTMLADIKEAVYDSITKVIILSINLNPFSLL